MSIKKYYISLNILISCFLVSNLNAEDLTKENPSEEEEIPLDAWIVNKKKKIEVTPSLSPTENSSPVVDETKQLEEDKRVYRALLDKFNDPEYIEEENRTNNAKQIDNRIPQTVFTKTALSKKDENRFLKIKKVQKKVLSSQKKEFYELLKVKENIQKYIRVCVSEFQAMGIPSDLKRLDPNYKALAINEDWKSSLKLVVQNECDLVLYTGLYGKTLTSGQEFVDKTNKLLNKITKQNWKYISYPKKQTVFYSLFYNEEKIKISSTEEIESISLRRGGDFIEEKFSLNPSQIIVEDVSSKNPLSIRLILFDLKDDKSPIKKLKFPHSLQMASALHEILLDRSSEKDIDSNILLGTVSPAVGNPVSMVVRGIISPSDFLPERACTFQVVKEEKVKNKAKKESKEEVVKEEKKENIIYTCDNSKIEKQPRKVFGVFSDLVQEYDKKSKKPIHYNFLSDFFLPESSLDVIKENPNKLFPYRYFGKKYKGKQNPYTFIWVDIKSEKNN